MVAKIAIHGFAKTIFSTIFHIMFIICSFVDLNVEAG